MERSRKELSRERMKFLITEPRGVCQYRRFHNSSLGLKDEVKHKFLKLPLIEGMRPSVGNGYASFTIKNTVK